MRIRANTVVAVLALCVGMAAVGIGIAAHVQLKRATQLRIDAINEEATMRQAQIDTVLDRSETTFGEPPTLPLLVTTEPYDLEVVQTGSGAPSFGEWISSGLNVSVAGTYSVGIQFSVTYASPPTSARYYTRVTTSGGPPLLNGNAQQQNEYFFTTVGLNGALATFDTIVNTIVLEEAHLPAVIGFGFGQQNVVTDDMTILSPTYVWATKLQ